MRAEARERELNDSNDPEQAMESLAVRDVRGREKGHRDWCSSFELGKEMLETTGSYMPPLTSQSGWRMRKPGPGTAQSIYFCYSRMSDPIPCPNAIRVRVKQLVIGLGMSTHNPALTPDKHPALPHSIETLY